MRIWSVLFILAGVTSCATFYFRTTYKDVNSFIHETSNLSTKPFLKAHLKNGEVFILKDSWQVDTNTVRGTGTHYDFKRKKIFEGKINLYIDSVAIFETNSKIIKPEGGRVLALGLLTALDVVFGIVCLTNPKACFGSCPTFYINENDNFHYADAEGFTDAIVPSLEYADIDALNSSAITNNTFSLTMKNEALETHCINDIKLLAYPRKNNERIYQTPSNEFYTCKNVYSVTKATAREGEITQLLLKPDLQERYSLADEKDLISPEEIYLDFDSLDVSIPVGLILHFRQTLMTTYLIYSAMGYMGDEVGDLFSKLESDNKTKDKMNRLIAELGAINVYYWNEKENNWQFQQRFSETGPIAINKQFIPIHNRTHGSQVKLKLTLNTGLWRIDFAGLTQRLSMGTPLEIRPDSIFNKGILDPIAMNDLNSSNRYLISMPGSAYKFTFTLPNPTYQYELFLYSKGYYIEWMRANWVKDKNLLKLYEMMNFPRQYLHTEAKYFKQYESTMEQAFWNSKLDTKIFTYHEN